MFIDILLLCFVVYGYLWVLLWLAEELALNMAKKKCGKWGWRKTYYGCDLLYDAEWLYEMNHPELKKRKLSWRIVKALIWPFYRLYLILRMLFEAYGEARDTGEVYYEMYQNACEDINHLLEKVES